MMQSVDLNLLVALDALLAEGSVTGAAQRLNLSVPAMSRTLNRLRILFDDPLFVRAGRGLVTTPYAEQLREPTRLCLQQAEQLLQKTKVLQPFTLRRVFTIRADDGTVALLAAGLLKKMAELAPKVTLRFIAQGQQDVGALRDGVVDLDIGVIEDIGPEIVRQTLFHDHYQIVMRQQHPLAKDASLTVSTFAAARHVSVSRRGVMSGPVDSALAQLGLLRHVAVVTHSFAEALLIVKETDLIATVPTLLTQPMQQGVVYHNLPFQTAGIRISQAWHPRFQSHPEHQFLRQLIFEHCQKVFN
ncbi:LysR family transcriptional regulator [Acinetobacter rudis]|uniref:LysR family transcriptional regulator n=1 Tax=Acinetobacter rudis TaxID=632955 RepID=UPI00280E57FF|nr:LysR family transcriptional regulator [Acinetobacter rudis]MDQ8952879.1 LysR family transcriptional regulator [Acinetobacter rudis]